MDIERFRTLLNDPAKTMQELLTMHKNARSKGSTEYVRLAEDALTVRFPGWNDVKSRKGRSTPVDVMFLGKHRHFKTEKDGYIWLIERFIQHYPRPFIELDWERCFVVQGSRVLYFAKSLTELFADTPHLAQDKNMFHHLTNGWYAKVVLSEPQKFSLLTKFGAVAQLKFGEDWDWKVPTQTHKHINIDDILPELGRHP